jgi:hypothetical protein
LVVQGSPGCSESAYWYRHDDPTGELLVAAAIADPEPLEILTTPFLNYI